jgi:hypothetical protein
MGATLKDVEYDEQKWQYHALAVKGDGSPTEKLVVDVITTLDQQSLVEESNLQKQLARKRMFLLRVYKTELENRLNADGIKIVRNQEVYLALEKSGFDLEEAFEYAVDHIYTRLKRINIEIKDLYTKLRKAKSDLGTLRDASDDVPLIKLGRQDKSKIIALQNEIGAMETRRLSLKEEGLTIVRDFENKLRAHGTRFSQNDIRECIQRNNWNTDKAFTELIRQK